MKPWATIRRIRRRNLARRLRRVVRRRRITHGRAAVYKVRGLAPIRGKLVWLPLRVCLADRQQSARKRS